MEEFLPFLRESRISSVLLEEPDYSLSFCAVMFNSVIIIICLMSYILMSTHEL